MKSIFIGIFAVLATPFQWNSLVLSHSSFCCGLLCLLLSPVTTASPSVVSCWGHTAKHKIRDVRAGCELQPEGSSRLSCICVDTVYFWISNVEPTHFQLFPFREADTLEQLSKGRCEDAAHFQTSFTSFSHRRQSVVKGFMMKLRSNIIHKHKSQS